MVWRTYSGQPRLSDFLNGSDMPASVMLSLEINFWLSRMMSMLFFIVKWLISVVGHDKILKPFSRSITQILFSVLW